MRKVAKRISLVLLLALAPIAGFAAVPQEASANHCWKCVGAFHKHCEQGGPEGNTANCEVTFGGLGCNLWGACID